MQVLLYYISSESWNFPLSNVIINVLEFTQIITILSILVISNPNIDFENVLYMEKYSLSEYIIPKVLYIQIDYIWNKQWIICYFLFSKHCIFAITQWFSYQYITYYIPLESSDFPLSNGIIVKVKFPYIFHLLKNILSISSATSAIQNTRI